MRTSHVAVPPAACTDGLPLRAPRPVPARLLLSAP